MGTAIWLFHFLSRKATAQISYREEETEGSRGDGLHRGKHNSNLWLLSVNRALC